MEVISGKIEKAKKVVLYGPEGIGKSSLASQFPKPIFIDTEGSTTELEVDRLPAPTSWTMLQQQVDWVKQQAGRFETLVIDTIDWAEMQCTNYVCAQHNKKGIEDFGYGQGYIYAKEELGRFLNKLSDVIEAGIHVVLTAHSQIVKFEQPDEMGAYDRYQLKLGKKTSSQTAPLVKEWADMVLFINYKTFSVAADDKGRKHKAQGGTRIMYTTHHPAWDAKNRHGLPEELPLNFSSIAHIFQKKSQPVNQPEPIQQTQPSPVEQPVTQPEPMQQSNAGNIEEPIQDTLDQNIPKALRDLMIAHNVSEGEIQIAVSQKGYYPQDTPITNYDPSFIEGVLVGAWQQVYGMIEEFRKNLPF
ncbi:MULTISPECIES: ATP-binding protein [Clostridia]|uniref:ATP-binding protein n=1 Tax=Clostridia TaxID=186801 RepID=UPI000EA2716E|nr:MULTISPECIES: ATP-binding protein [Clostridia]NBJ71025.1 ATP-binding protein [Roseburia sp. 1XD42-34]RKI75460.1 ATP-binding protein [Clostridium sp. 1xD42-85]